MIKIELASYPKCGNTWLRHLLSNHFELNIHTDIPDYHQRHDETLAFIKPVKINGEDVGFYKSHVPNSKSLNPDKIVVIYRHPLDVFFSCLNYFYINSWADKFIDKELKSVDQIVADGELEFYFNDFLINKGRGYFDSLLGDYSDYFEYMQMVKAMPNVYLLKYEDLYDGRGDYFSGFLSELLETKVEVNLGLFVKVDDKTKNSGDKFYWKSKKKNYESYLSDELLKIFNDKHASFLREFGY